MKKRLRHLRKDKSEIREIEVICPSYDVVGDIAIMRFPVTLELSIPESAKALLKTNNHVKTVLCQTSPVSGDFRLRNLAWVAGEKKTVTIYKEYGCSFKVDLERCYFSPRLSYERLRISRLVKQNEVIINMFAGVGCYSVIISKHSSPRRVYSIDFNPIAFNFLKENARFNRVENQIIPILGEAKEIIEVRLHRIADRVIMPLPEKANEYIETALLALKSKGGIIHYYDFEHASKGENVIEKTIKQVSERLETMEVDFSILSSRIVRTTGPNWYQIVLDIETYP